MSEFALWHSEDGFWQAFAPFMFHEDRLAATPTEVDQLLALTTPDPEAKILDLGCGPGRHSLELARRGFEVTGVDRTSIYLEEARAIAAEQLLVVEFVQDDMRAFLRQSSFDVVLSMYTSFGYFKEAAENLQVLSNIFGCLRPGGFLLMEIMGKEVLARVFQERDWREQDGIFFLQERKIVDNWNRIENRWLLLHPERRLEYRLDHWLYSSSELKSLLQSVGFGSIEIYGGLDGSPYDNSATRLVVVARKPTT
jgi:SAM-dependent methyltransferase